MALFTFKKTTNKDIITDDISTYDPIIFNGKITNTSPLTIHTAKEQWSYAIAFDLKASQMPFPKDTVIEIDCTVISGVVGCIAVEVDHNILCSNQAIARKGERKKIKLRMYDIEKAKLLVIRNHEENNTPSRIVIHTIYAYSLKDYAQNNDIFEENTVVSENNILDARYLKEFLNKFSPIKQWKKFFSNAHNSNIKPDTSIHIIEAENLSSFFHSKEVFTTSATSLSKSFYDWKMEIDDAPLLRYIFRHIKPKRHLEFGTWRGFGTVCCLEETDASVWTINLPEGEKNENNVSLYASSDHATDSGLYIGSYYREKNLGHRVCQIYCDSQAWDISAYPFDFFDSVFIDGGHTPDVVLSDTIKALSLLRPGGICMWHDFCPSLPVMEQMPSSFGVVKAIIENSDFIHTHIEQLYWIKPSFLLIGIKK